MQNIVEPLLQAEFQLDEPIYELDAPIYEIQPSVVDVIVQQTSEPKPLLYIGADQTKNQQGALPESTIESLSLKEKQELR